MAASPHKYTTVVVELTPEPKACTASKCRCEAPKGAAVWIEHTIADPEVILKRARKRFGDRVVGLRPDLVRFRRRTRDRQVAKQRKDHLKRQLLMNGYDVEGVTTYRVYVVELDSSHLGRKSDKGYVYVGESSKCPGVRFEQHKRGYKANGSVRQHGRRLMYRLMPKWRLATQSESKRFERKLAADLDERGYRVEAGDATPNRKRGPDNE